jgi:hypothetical protein
MVGTFLSKFGITTRLWVESGVTFLAGAVLVSLK